MTIAAIIQIIIGAFSLIAKVAVSVVVLKYEYRNTCGYLYKISMWFDLQT